MSKQKQKDDPKQQQKKRKKTSEMEVLKIANGSKLLISVVQNTIV